MACQFCPSCANLLTIEAGKGAVVAFRCRTCAYMYRIEEKLTAKHMMQRKEVDDVLGGMDVWKDVDQTDAVCPSCSCGRAFFRQVQTRSADEPMTVFYKCTRCMHNWKED
eukprot:NODE_19409_length_844_cov_5.868898.p1 GENE.NODE_19409_length_844_cov_5.868898~~NODE_19409_length_844_cov_5.868898.p1  ORF type:complete len:110 (-),score=30.64 NODE_19409_length_844_cov_5.868898:331-660(-)